MYATFTNHCACSKEPISNTMSSNCILMVQWLDTRVLPYCVLLCDQSWLTLFFQPLLSLSLRTKR